MPFAGLRFAGLPVLFGLLAWRGLPVWVRFEGSSVLFPVSGLVRFADPRFDLFCSSVCFGCELPFFFWAFRFTVYSILFEFLMRSSVEVCCANLSYVKPCKDLGRDMLEVQFPHSHDFSHLLGQVFFQDLIDAPRRPMLKHMRFIG